MQGTFHARARAGRGQDAIRRRVMSCVVAVRAPFQPQLAAAHDGRSRRAIQTQMRDAA